MTTTLKIYFSSFGKWTGLVFVDDAKVCHISGCHSPAAVQSEAYGKGYVPDAVVML